MGNSEDATCLRFGGFELQPAERRLLADGQPVPIGPHAFDVLVALARRAGQLVTKGELLDLVWPDRVVEEGNLQVHVWALRKILGKQAIVTVPGHGYRFALVATRDLVPPAPPAPASKHNLPEQVTSFVGRVRELAEIKEFLGRTRLLTLVGFGGIGKTRLSLQTAADMAPAFADGVWFVELAPVTDARLVAQAVATALGVTEEAGRPVLEALLKYGKDRRALLILDTCEHLLHACAELAKQLLQSGPKLKILATSRERLNLAGEMIYLVTALSVPDPKQSITSTALTQYDGVRMFIDRATTAQPAFRVTDQNAATVAEICERVDGIPLAIELAAARMRALSLAKLAERLRDRFGLLTRGDPLAAPRLQTLRALIDWSFDLLNENERALLRRLAVFAGGWTLEAAEAVGAGGDVDAADVLDLLSELVEKSLVVLEADGEHYRLLDTVHEYAGARLAESGDERRARAQHLVFYLALAEKARPELFRPQQQAWLANLDVERENILSAHAWCDRAEGGALSGLRLAFALKPYWFRCGLLGLGFRFTVEALARPGAETRDLARCRALLDAGHLASFMNSNDEARSYLEECLAIAREIGNSERAASALRLLGIASFQSGDLAAARCRFEEALALARELGDPFRIFDAVDSLAGFHREGGDFEVAERLYEENLSRARERGDLDGIAMTLANLAMVQASRGLADRAPGLLLEALAIAENGGSRWPGQLVVAVSSGLAAMSGEWRSAAQLYGAAIGVWEQMGVHRDPAEDTFMAPLIARTREALGPAAFAAAETAGRTLAYEAALAEARACLREVRKTSATGCAAPSRRAPRQ